MSATGVYQMQQDWGFTKDHLVMLCLVPWGNENSGDYQMPPSWYDATKRWVACKVCGQREEVHPRWKQYVWLEKHEQMHVRKAGRESVAAFYSLLAMRDPGGLAKWTQMLREWRSRHNETPLTYLVSPRHPPWREEARVMLECGRDVFGIPCAVS